MAAKNTDKAEEQTPAPEPVEPEIYLDDDVVYRFKAPQ